MTRIEKNEDEMIRLVNSIGYRHPTWQVWQDFVFMAAIAISNVVDASNREERERQYMKTAEKYNPDELNKFSEMLSVLVLALEENPEQDFLGKIFMGLNLGNHWKGQFFTPYSVCQLMSEINVSTAEQKIDLNGWCSVSDPACGAGATLISMANTLRKKGVDFQRNVIFAAQDIDVTAALMCYLQLSLLGCSGVIVIRDTLLHPMTGNVLFQGGSDTWLTPMYFHEVWRFRRMAAMLDGLCNRQISKKQSQENRGEPQRDNKVKVYDEAVQLTFC